ncbi:hypothetical protein ACH3XW_25630 [Acanthocheilonema viteae]|uniref:Lysozyme n=1 Tax=Acanthocheilonema viteae TaxID=6277 RepID=A0A498SGX2_ACAVI|nr:unnamed protein product [Acanthocheilonema viteae]
MFKIIANSELETPGNGYSQAIDISTQTDQNIFRCLFQKGFTVAFIRAYQANGNGGADSNCIANIYNAVNEGLGVEIYVEPQPRATKSGTEQFMEVYNFLTNNNIAVKAIWIKLTTPIIWPNNQVVNVNFINDFIMCAWRHGLIIGIYTNWYDWKQIAAGQLTSNQGQIRLWYWNTLGSGWEAATSPMFDDFRPFAGFSKPAVKQYVQNIYVCGICTSLNIYVNKIAMKAFLPVNMRRLKMANATVGMLSIMTKFSKNKLENENKKKTDEKSK